MISAIYWECISLGAGTRVGESYNLLGICVVVVVVVRVGGDVKSSCISLLQIASGEKVKEKLREVSSANKRAIPVRLSVISLI